MHCPKFNFTRIFTSIAIVSIAIFIFLQIFAPVKAATGINRQINFQGKLVANPQGTNVSNTSYTVIFTLYDNTSGGTALWTETQTVTTVDGIFRVALSSVTPFPANFNFNWGGLYLGIKINSDSEMTPRVQMSAVPFAFNAEKVAGLTVQDTSGNASTSGTLQVGNGITVKLPTSGTGLIYADSASTGTLATLSNSITQTGSVIGQAITLSGATGSLNQTGLQFNLSGATSGTTLDIQGTSNSWGISRAGAFGVGGLYGNSGDCLKSGGAVTSGMSWGACGTSSGLSFWGSVGGLNYPVDTFSDLAIGGTSTASALFSFTGVKTGQTIASASGNLIVMANNGWGGNVGVGTTNPTHKLELASGTTGAGGIGFGTDLQLYRKGVGEFGIDTNGSAIPTYFSILATAGQNARIGVGQAADAYYRAVMQADTTGAGFEFGPGTTVRDIRLYRSGAKTFSLDDTAGNPVYFGIGTTTLLATFDLRSANGTLAVASVSGKTSFAALVVDQSGVGDIFTASKGGATRFTITNAGLLDSVGDASISGSLIFKTNGGGQIQTSSNQALTIGGNTTGQITLSALNGTQNIRFAGYTTAGCTLKTDTSGLVTCGTDLQGGGGGGASYIDQNNGLTYVGNVTTDFAIGGTSTNSAKYVFGVGTNGSTAIATFSGALMMDAQANSSNYDQTNWRKVSQSTPGTIAEDGGSTSAIASISAMVSYNGSLYVGTYKNPSGTAGSAEVYRYDNGGANWTKVSQAAGTIAEDASSTTGIASVSAMTVFDGYLYVGTSKMNEGEVYRYDGGATWSKVSGPAAGTFGPAAITGLDSVTALAVYQGRMYAGISEPGAGRLMRWEGGVTWTAVNTTAGQFAATTTAGVHNVGPMVVKNGFLYFAAYKGTDADVLRYAGGVSNTSAYFMSMNAAGTTTTGGRYTINNVAISNFDEVTAMTVYNGSVIVALRKGNNLAEVVALNDGMPVGTVSPDSWTRLNNVTGQMTSGGTQNIDAVRSLVVHKGILYAATQDGAGAEIYKYVGGDQKWAKVSQAAGTIQIGGTAGIDAVTNMVAINDDLFASTMSNYSEAGGAEVYRLANVNLNKSYSILFHAAPNIAGGEQSGNENLASIFFLASASANLGSTAGNTGAFIFSHGIQTRNGSYDVAEDYPTRDDSLQPGDLVAVDKNEKGFVKKTEVAYDYSVLGVYSEKPALRLSQEDVSIDGGRAIPVALAGRVPVKVSTESGVIKIGDYLTSSSVPGVAMKATKSSVVIGQALENYSEAGNGKVLSFIKSMTYSGSIAEEFANLDTTSPGFAVNVLDKLSAQNQSDGKSNVITDRLIAGLEIITPKLSSTEVNLNEINVLSGSNITLNLSEDGKFIIKNAMGAAAITFDSNGNAYFSGLVFADRIKANQIEGLEILTNQLSSLSNNVAVLSSSTQSGELASSSAQITNGILNINSLNLDGLATISGDITVKGNGLIQGVLNVLQSITTQNLTVSDFAYFVNDVVFKGNVRFNQAPTFSSDTAGFAVISKGKDTITINFDNEYNNAPVVTASIVLDKVGDSVAQKQLEDAVLNGNISYVITQRTTKGFILRLSKPTEQDLNFSWVALSVKDVKTSGIMPTLMPISPASPSAGAQSILNLLNNSPGSPPPN